MMLRKIILPKMEVLLKDVFILKTGLSNWPVQSKNFIGRQFQIRRLSDKDKYDKEGNKSKVHEYVKKAPSMQQRSQEQIKELRDLRVKLIKERKILQKRLKENEEKIRHEKKQRAPNEKEAASKFTYKLKMSRVVPKTKNLVFNKSDEKLTQFQKFIQNFGKSVSDDQSIGERSVQYNKLIETPIGSNGQTPPTEPKSPNQGRNFQFDGKSFQKNAVGFAQRTLYGDKNNKIVAEASNTTSKDPPNTKSKSNVNPKDARVNFRSQNKSKDILKPTQVISTVTKKESKKEAFEKARAERNRKLRDSNKGTPETSHLTSKLSKRNVLVPIQNIMAKSKDISKEKTLSIHLEPPKKTENPLVSKLETPIKLNPKVLDTKDNVEKDETNEKSPGNKSPKKKIFQTVRVPIPSKPYDVLTQARKLRDLKTNKAAQKSISEDRHDDTPYSQLNLDPKVKFQAYIEKIQQQQTQFKKGVVEPTQTSSLDTAKSISPSRPDLEKCSANLKQSSLERNFDLVMPNESIESEVVSNKPNIPPKILEQLKYAKIRNQKFLIKEIKDQLKRELIVANNKMNKNSNQNKTESTKTNIDQKPILGESQSEVAPSKKIMTEATVHDIEASAKMFLRSLEQFVQSLRAADKINNNNKDEKK